MTNTFKCVLLFLLSSMAVCSVVGQAFAASPIKIMSFNIRYDATLGKPTDQDDSWLATSGQHRRDLVVQVLKDSDPDIVCLQEALKHQVDDLMANLPNHEFYGVGRDDGDAKGEYSGIFYRRDRFHRGDQGNFWLNENPDQPGTRFPKTCCARLATWVVLQDTSDDNREFFLLNTHWDHQVQDARLFSAQLIRQRLKTLAGKRPILLTGDLNATTDNPAFQLLINATEENKIAFLDSLREAHPQQQENEGTLNYFRGKTDGPRIDYVLHTSAFKTQSAEIVRDHDQKRYPSDHFPFMATLVLADESGN